MFPKAAVEPKHKRCALAKGSVAVVQKSNITPNEHMARMYEQTVCRVGCLRLWMDFDRNPGRTNDEPRVYRVRATGLLQIPKRLDSAGIYCLLGFGVRRRRRQGGGKGLGGKHWGARRASGARRGAAGARSRRVSVLREVRVTTAPSRSLGKPGMFCYVGARVEWTRMCRLVDVSSLQCKTPKGG